MKLDWCTDIHQDFLAPQRQEAFVNRLINSQSDAILITGDISTARELEKHLTYIAERVTKPIYYVLGNHDIWYSSFADVYEICHKLELKFPHLQHLNNRTFVNLTDDVALVGHDSWYDAIIGEWKTSRFELPDWYFIKDFVDAGASVKLERGRYDINLPRVVGKCRALASKAIIHLENGVQSALIAGKKKILIATHVPPFAESHIHQGKIGSDEASPWFTSGLLGDFLHSTALANPDKIFVSFSGHTHGSYNGVKEANLHVHVGGARYGHPEIVTTIQL